MKQMAARAVLTLLFCAGWTTQANSSPRQIDIKSSTLTIHVYKTGLLSALAHNHEIEAPIETGTIDDSGIAASSWVQIVVKAANLRVLDSGDSKDTRAKIQNTMLSSQVLDVDHFPEIHFESDHVEPKGARGWIVHGNLDLHGQTHPISVEVTFKDGSYRGSAVLKQTEFGITPVRIAGGTVRVKDEVQVEFVITPTK